MKNLIHKTKAFLADEQGAETVEWVIVVTVLATIIAATSWVSLQDAVNSAITTIVNCMDGDCSP